MVHHLILEQALKSNRVLVIGEVKGLSGAQVTSQLKESAVMHISLNDLKTTTDPETGVTQNAETLLAHELTHVAQQRLRDLVSEHHPRG